MARKVNQEIINNAINKIENYYRFKIIDNDGLNIIYTNNDGLKEKSDKYKILKNEFSPFSHSLRESNEFAVYNANLLANKNNNKFNSIVLSISKQNAQIKCGKCGNIYEQSVRHFISESCEKVCPKCYGDVHIGKRTDEDEIFKKIEECGFQILPNQHYKEIHEKIGITKDGYKGEMCYVNIMKGAQISPFAKYNVYALENIRYYCKQNGIECVIPNQKYKGWDLPFKVQCSCGKLFTTTLTHFMDGKTSCDYCTKRQSLYETIIEDWLKTNNIKHQKQYKYQDCFYKKPLPFDFYLDDFNTLIEVDGEGHFQPTYYNGMGKDKAILHFKETQRNDDIKNRYCESHNIQLIRISYIDIKNNNYKNILQNLFIGK